MLSTVIQPARIAFLNKTAVNSKGRYVLYWMQQSQRSMYNHALEYAVERANKLRLPVLVVFGLTADYPEANWRHYAFMLEGLQDLSRHLKQRRIPLKIEIGSPDAVALKASRQAALVVCDRGYLRHQGQWRQNLARKAACAVMQVESDAVVPVSAVSQKAEYAARTIRPKLHRLLERHLVPLKTRKLKTTDTDLAEAVDVEGLLSQLDIDRTVAPVTNYLPGGCTAAHRAMNTFVNEHLRDYDTRRDHPDRDGSSRISPYLHFGQISPLEIALQVRAADAPRAAKEAFLEELIVRRELAINHVVYCNAYDCYGGLPEWARRTLSDHMEDVREPAYSLKTLESARTHDPYWNAAMDEMKWTGYMHTYMRMYWGKKILQWSRTPETAHVVLLKLNNTYFVDGRDANSYCGVSWIFGLHDRPWKERAIFGKVRYMARSGLERKFNIQGYVDKVRRRIAALNTAQRP